MGAMTLHAADDIAFHAEIAGGRDAVGMLLTVMHDGGNGTDHRAHREAAEDDAGAERSAREFEKVAHTHDEHPIVLDRGTNVAQSVCNPMNPISSNVLSS